MKKADLQPTDENIKKNIRRDPIGRNDYIIKFIHLINSLDDSFSIAIDGKWGSGKTFFIKQTKYLLDHYHNDINNEIKEKIKKAVNGSDIRIKTVYYDAWENDDEKNPIESITKEIGTSSFLNTAIDKVLPLVSSALKIATESKIDLRSLASDYTVVDEHEKNKKAFNKCLDNLIDKEERLVIFVDEIDRCRPSYAVKLLETIKHFFQCNENITFVFATNVNQLQNTIKNFYGTNFNGLKYLDRFFDIRIELPEVDKEKYIKTIDRSYIPGDPFYHSLKSYDDLFDFSLREINHFHMMTRIACNFIENVSSQKIAMQGYWQLLSCYFIVPLLIGTCMHSTDDYNKLIYGDNMEFFVSTITDNEAFVQFIKTNNLINTNEKNEKDNINKLVTALYEKIFMKNGGYSVGSVPHGIDQIGIPNNALNMILNQISLLTNKSDYSSNQDG